MRREIDLIWHTRLCAQICVVITLSACAESPSDKLDARFSNATEFRDGLPLVIGDVKLDAVGEWNQAVIVEVLTDREYQLFKEYPPGKQRGRIMDGLAITHGRRGDGKYWARIGRFSGRREFGILVSLVELPIDRRSGYLFVTDETPDNKLIRNSYLMGEFRSFFWQSPGDDVPQDAATAAHQAPTDDTVLVFNPPDGVRPVSDERFRELRKRGGPMRLVYTSGMTDLNALKDGGGGVWESESQQLIIIQKRLDQQLPKRVWDGTQFHYFNLTHQEQMPLADDDVYHYYLQRLSRGVRMGRLKSSSSVDRKANVAGYPAILASLDVEGGWIRAFDVRLSNRRHAVWLVQTDSGPDTSLISEIIYAFSAVVQTKSQ